MKTKKSTPSRETVTLKLQAMFDAYAKHPRAQNVSFRRLVPWIKVGERATHYLHSYPAKLLPHIAHFFLAAEQLSQVGDRVLDPFSGSGTVALETQLAERRPVVCELNPLARLITKVKTQPLALDEVKDSVVRVQSRRKKILTSGQYVVPSVVNVSHWFDSSVICELGALRSAILLEPPGAIRDFLLVSFSHACRKASRTDPRLSVPVRLKEYFAPPNLSSWDFFDQQVEANIIRFQKRDELQHSKSRFRMLHAGQDARRLTVGRDGRKALPSGSIRLVITSPPYAGAQKYVRASSLSLGWLGLATPEQLKPLEDRCIGREHFPKKLCDSVQTIGLVSADRLIQRIFALNPTRSRIFSTYLLEMNEVLKEIARVLVPGGYLVLVIGNNQVCGFEFRSSDFIRELAEKHGLQTRLRLIDEIRSRGLMTKRNKTASVITREWVLILQKPGTSPTALAENY